MHYFTYWFGKELYMFRIDLLPIIMPNKQNTSKHINMRTLKENCVSSTRQCRITRYAEKIS